MSVYSRSVNYPDRVTAALLEPTDSVPHCPPQISNGLVWDWTGATAARGRRLTYQLAQSACHYTECMDIPHPTPPLVPSALRFILQCTSLYSAALMQPCCSQNSEGHVIAFAIDKLSELALAWPWPWPWFGLGLALAWLGLAWLDLARNHCHTTVRITTNT